MIKYFSLSNNIKVITEHIPYLRSVSIGVWVNTGSAYETVENNGISHVIEHMLFKGTTSKSAKDIADLTARLGGNLNAFTGKECTSFYVRTLDVHLDEALDLLSDMYINSVIDESDLSREKYIIADEIDMYEDSPEDMVHELLQKEVWKNHPLGYIISGDKKNVNSFTREQILEYKHAHYTGANTVISIAGNFNQENISLQLEKYFGVIEKGDSVNNYTVPIFNKCSFHKKKDIEQMHLDIAYDAITSVSEERYAFTVLNSIIGGSVNSRLFQRIREELGLVYSIYSYGSTFKNAGLFQVYAAFNPSQLDDIQEEIDGVFKEIINNPISEYELINAKEEIKTELIIGSESTQNRMENNAKSILQFDKVITIDETIRQIDMVSQKDIMSIIDKYINTNNISISIMGNK